MAKSNILTVCITAPESLCDFLICVKDESGNVMAEQSAGVGNCEISLPDGKFKVSVAGNACAAPKVQERWVQFCGSDPCVSECFSISFIFNDICGSHCSPPAPPLYGPPICPYCFGNDPYCMHCHPHRPPCHYCGGHDPHCIHCHPHRPPCHYCGGHDPHCHHCHPHFSVPCSPYPPYFPQFPVANWQFHYKEPVVCGPDGRKICPPPKCPPPPPGHRPPTGSHPHPKKQNRFCGLIKFR